MNDKTLLKIIAGVIVAPIVLGAVGSALTGIGWIADKIAYKRKIKKGLKDGSIVEINGVYYNVYYDKGINEET